MKLTKVPVLLFTTALLLSACNNNSIAGKYGFQMGKEKGTHFGLFMELTDDYITLETQPEETNKYKRAEFSFTIKMGEDDDSESISNILKTLSELLNQDGDVVKIPAYYYKGNKIPKTENIELKVGIDFNFIKDIVDDVDTSAVFPVLQPETIEKLIYTTYGKNQITMYVPVGQEDALFQLYWYGVDVYKDGEGNIVIATDLPAHEPGTHPTAADIEAINKDNAYGAAHEWLGPIIGADLSSYRDYYTLAMGLIKQ